MSGQFDLPLPWFKFSSILKCCNGSRGLKPPAQLHYLRVNLHKETRYLMSFHSLLPTIKCKHLGIDFVLLRRPSLASNTPVTPCHPQTLAHGSHGHVFEYSGPQSAPFPSPKCPPSWPTSTLTAWSGRHEWASVGTSKSTPCASLMYP